MNFFKDKVIWITGASSGIGAEMALQFASPGTFLILTARNAEALATVQQQCIKLGAGCVVITADLGIEKSLPGIVGQALKAFGRIDILVNNAGVSQRAFAEETDLAIDRQIMELNYFAPVALTKLLLHQFKTQGSGHIVAISSMAGLMGFPKRSAYAASKHAIKGFFETLQTEDLSPGIHITLVYPGRISTSISYTAITGNGTPYGKMDDGQLNGIPVARCAATIIRAIKKKKRRVIIARGERLLWWFWFFLPRLYLQIARNYVKRH